MRVLLLRPDPGNERFGLGPFFRVEPLGLEYIGAALRARGHEPRIADLRFRPGLDTWIRRTRPQLVGISCLHSLEYDQVRATARAVQAQFVGGVEGSGVAIGRPPQQQQVRACRQIDPAQGGVGQDVAVVPPKR